jgi:hypothetical protein
MGKQEKLFFLFHFLAILRTMRLDATIIRIRWRLVFLIPERSPALPWASNRGHELERWL